MKKTKGQYGFFDIENQLDKIYEINDFLPKLDTLVDWEMFRHQLNKVREKERKSNAGRPAFDVVLMFKTLVIKTMYDLSDDQTEMPIRDRISFRAFLGLSFADTVPDSKTIWDFVEQLQILGLERPLFDRFNKELEKQGFATRSGYIVDGTFVDVPRQRNTKEENEPYFRNTARRARFRSVSRRIPTFSHKKTSKPNGRRRATRRISDTKTMSLRTMNSNSFATSTFSGRRRTTAFRTWA